MKSKKYKIKVEFTDGYQKRFTQACLQQIARREREKKEKINTKA